MLGLLVGVAALTVHLSADPPTPPGASAPPPTPRQQPHFAPTEEIDVEEAVDYPYDI
jgi:hypothetical protein